MFLDIFSLVVIGILIGFVIWLVVPYISLFDEINEMYGTDIKPIFGGAPPMDD